MAGLYDASGMLEVCAGKKEAPMTAPTNGMPRLTALEGQVLALVVDGLTNKAIGAALFLEADTVKEYVSKLLRKFGAKNRTELAVKAHDYETGS